MCSLTTRMCARPPITRTGSASGRHSVEDASSGANLPVPSRKARPGNQADRLRPHAPVRAAACEPHEKATLRRAQVAITAWLVKSRCHLPSCWRGIALTAAGVAASVPDAAALRGRAAWLPVEFAPFRAGGPRRAEGLESLQPAAQATGPGDSELTDGGVADGLAPHLDVAGVGMAFGEVDVRSQPAQCAVDRSVRGLRRLSFMGRLLVAGEVAALGGWLSPSERNDLR
jgi:hypothetical protein